MQCMHAIWIKIELNKKFQSCEIFSNKPINYSLETAATKRTGEFESIWNFQQKTNLITRRKLQPQNVPVTSESRALVAATSRRSAMIVSLCSCTCLLSSTLSRWSCVIALASSGMGCAGWIISFGRWGEDCRALEVTSATVPPIFGHISEVALRNDRTEKDSVGFVDSKENKWVGS